MTIETKQRPDVMRINRLLFVRLTSQEAFKTSQDLRNEQIVDRIRIYKFLM